MTDRHLAHFNWGFLKAPVGDPLVAGFVAGVEKVNARAESAPGFVWRNGQEDLQARRIGWDLFTQSDRIIASYSVWERPEDLHNFVYKTVHGAFLKRRDDWFAASESVNYALWWVPRGHVPSISVAREKVEDLRANGPSDRVFGFDSLVLMGDS